MLLVLLLAAVLWGVGAYWGLPVRQRWMAILGLWVFVIFVNLVLPETHPLRVMTGRDPVLWLLFGAFVALIAGYRVWLNRMRARAKPAVPPEKAPESRPFQDAELERYARHIVLRELGGAGQRRLKQARVLVIGAGGLGAPALQYLAAAGVGTIGVIDDDVVENANLQRQVIHNDAEIGTAKVFSAQKAMLAQNPYVTVRPYHRRLTGEIAQALFADYDVILDGTDNFETRYLANRTAVAAGKPLISGALAQWEGQLSVFDPKHHGPCYQCVFPQAPAAELAPSCAEAGVVGPLPGVIGAMMAVEAIKVITDAGAAMRGQMLIYDALFGETRQIGLKRREDCPICGNTT